MRGAKEQPQAERTLVPPQHGAGPPRGTVPGRATVPPPPLTWSASTPTLQPHLGETHSPTRQVAPIPPLRLPPAGVQRREAVAPPPVRMPASAPSQGMSPPAASGGRAALHAQASVPPPRARTQPPPLPVTTGAGTARTRLAQRSTVPGSGAIQLAKQKGSGQKTTFKDREAAKQAQREKVEAKKREEANKQKLAIENEMKAKAEREAKAKAERTRKAEEEKRKAAIESEFRRHEDIARLLETPANVCVAVVQSPQGLLAAANKGVIGTFGWVQGTVTVSQNVAVETTEEPLMSTARKLDAYLQSGASLAQAVGHLQQVRTTDSDQVHAEMKLLNYIDQNRQQFPGAVELYISRICCANCSAAIDIWNRWKSPKVTVRKGSSASRWPGWAKPVWMTQHTQADADYDLWAQQWQQQNQGFTDVTGLSTRRPRSDSDPISRVQTAITLV